MPSRNDFSDGKTIDDTSRMEFSSEDKLDSFGLVKQKGKGQPAYTAQSRQADISELFQPLNVGRAKLRNRIVYAPLTRCRATGNVPQDNAIKYYTQRAHGCEGGLIIAEGTAVSESGRGYPDVPGIYDQEQILQWKKITEAVKAHGATFYCQLWHTGRVSHSGLQPNAAAPVSSFATACAGDVYTPHGPEPYPIPTALDKAGIAEMVDVFRQAARNAIDAGFDGVEVHGANGYLIDQFIKPKPNQRTDEYGGSVQNRCRFALEVIQAVVEEAGADRVGLRLSAFQEFGDVADPDPYATNKYLIKEINRFNLAYLHMVEPRASGAEDTAGQFEDQDLSPFRKLFNGPFMAAGGYNRERAIAALKQDHADLITFGRHYLANPDLPRRFRESAPLNKYDRATFYGGDDKGYTDYPFLPDSHE
ncbi:hypothetical protein WJX79_010845 [Trebouxia sp. C0005]